MRLLPQRLSAKILLLLVLPMALNVAAITYSELRNDPNLTPEKFAAHFRKFDFKFRADVQSPDRFLKSKSGDCDDFSTLADNVLRARGYQTRLISVRMNGVVHVVCYVKEAGGYLDYNYRKSGSLIPCADDFGAIARQVGAFYNRSWTSVSEFTYSEGLKRLVSTVKPQIAPVTLIADASSASRVSGVMSAEAKLAP